MPSAIISDPVNRFVYVTDYASNELIGYSIQTGNVLKSLVNGPFKTGNEPSAITIDPRGLYIYVTDALDSSLSCYSITQASGTPTIISSSTASSSTATDTQPVGILVDPAMGRLVYTVNYLGNSISGFHLDPNTGVLTTVVATPYPISSYRPTAIAIMPHGNHSVEVVTP
jgi:6-phosphogluconolactonase (cycloisomerase 2 family)